MGATGWPDAAFPTPPPPHPPLPAPTLPCAARCNTHPQMPLGGQEQHWSTCGKREVKGKGVMVGGAHGVGPLAAHGPCA